ncbi:MAG: sugar phosphate isomerase/epimerase family protein, partial [Vicinamibacteria bacterium]
MSASIDRREFLARTALGAAAMAVPLPPTRMQTPSQPAGRMPTPAGMFISLPPWAVARNVGWPEQARLAARVGYKGIDWAFGPAKTAGVDATKALLAELGIVATITNLPMQNPLGGEDAAFDAQLPKLAEDAAFCRAIGCRRFQLVLGATTVNGQSKEERWKVVQGRLSAIGGVLAKHDVAISIEFLGPLMFRRARPRPGAPRRTARAAAEAERSDPVAALPETLRLCEASGPNVGVTL